MQNDSHNLTTWAYRIGGWIFPSLTELQIALAYSVGFGLLLTHPSVLKLLWEVAFSTPNIDIGVVLADILFLTVIIWPLVAILQKSTLSNSMKVFTEGFYFLFLALLALAALGSSQLSEGAVGSFTWINLWIARVALGLAVLRALLAIIAGKSEDPDLERFVSQNFRDTQYRLAAFAVTLIIGVGSVLVLQHFYSNAAVVALLSLTYSGVAVGLLSKLQAMALN